LRAERKAGELLQQLERDKGGDRHSSTFQAGILSEYRAVLTENDIAPTTAHRWQAVATVHPTVQSTTARERRNRTDAPQWAAMSQHTIAAPKTPLRG